MNREELRGQWEQVKGRLQEHWGQLTDNDLQVAEGSADRLIGVVQEKTGATRSEIEEFIDHAMDRGHSAMQRASESASHYADEAADIARHQYERAAAATGQMSQKIAHTVRSRPKESLAIAFGLGIAAGALIFLGRRR